MGDQIMQKTRLVNQAARKTQPWKNYALQWGLVCVFYSWPLKMEPIYCPETSERNYHYSCVIAQKSTVIRCLDNLRAVFGKFKPPPPPPPGELEFATWMKVASPVGPASCPRLRQEKKKDSPATLCPQIVGNWPLLVEVSWNVMAHAQKPDFVLRRNGRVHLNRALVQSTTGSRGVCISCYCW
jgi:hypothetical protein